MPTVSVQIKNLPQIRAAFRKAPALTVRRVNDAIKKSAFNIERESKIRTPVLTGFLRASHQTRFSMLKGEIEPMANYAGYVHWGTRRMRGRPFLLQAVETSEHAIQRFFTEAVQMVLDEIARDTQ